MFLCRAGARRHISKKRYDSTFSKHTGTSDDSILQQGIELLSFLYFLALLAYSISLSSGL